MICWKQPGGLFQSPMRTWGLRVSLSSEVFIGLEARPNDKDGSGFGFPQEGLEATPVDGLAFQVSDPGRKPLA